jgi:hypothetical protein
VGRWTSAHRKLDSCACKLNCHARLGKTRARLTVGMCGRELHCLQHIAVFLFRSCRTCIAGRPRYPCKCSPGDGLLLCMSPVAGSTCQEQVRCFRPTMYCRWIVSVDLQLLHIPVRIPHCRDDAHHPPTQLVSRVRLGTMFLLYYYWWCRHLCNVSAFKTCIPHIKCVSNAAGPENGEHFNGDMSPGDVTGSDSPAKPDVEAGHGTDVVRFKSLIDFALPGALPVV